MNSFNLHDTPVDYILPVYIPVTLKELTYITHYTAPHLPDTWGAARRFI